MPKQKRKTEARDKRRRPMGDKATAPVGEQIPLEELRARVEKALGLLDGETADAIISQANGAQPEEYQTLIQGVQAVMGMNWAACKSAGMRETRQSLDYGAKTLTITLTLIHYAYALGLQRGQEGAGG